VWEDLTAGWRSFALAAAIDLDLFTHIDAGKYTAAEIAAAAGADTRAMGLLCEAMTGLKYLRKEAGRFVLEPMADAYLVRGRELYMEHQGTLTRGGLGAVWSGLADVVRRGKPAAPQNHEATVGFFRMLVKGIFPLSYVPAQAAVAALFAKVRDRVHDILDVAAGSGAWSLPFAQEIPHARVAALDFAPVLEVTREYAERYNVADRYEYIGGDLNEVDFGTERYDLVILGQILHGLGRERARRVIEKSAAALRKKGMILIAEFIANDERTGPEIPMLFGLNMLVSTPEGDVYTMAEFREWLKGAGMKSVKTIRAPLPSPLVLATK
jgi:ubiquinone/menaquinone biosynthesis C-methylase UbiE